MEHSPADSWKVSERAFPATGPIDTQLRFLLNYATLAPSKHNTQPWLFHVEQNSVELYADRTRVLSLVDANGRELIMSCGAALANLLVALRYFGFSWMMEMPSSPGKENLLARLTIEKGEEAGKEERKLFFAIMQRRTNRRAFSERGVPIALLKRLEKVAGNAGTYLHVMWDEEQRANLANLVLDADRTLWSDQQFRHELAEWVRPNESNSTDGIPAYALGKADTTSYLGQLTLHTLIEAAEEDEEVPQRTVKPPVLAVLATVNDDWFDWFAAGLALENMLLHARLAGIWASFFSQPTEVPVQRQALRDLLGETDFPQIVLRLGYATRVPPTPRRGVDDVLK
ncbi:MAG: nitroreductase [Ktedonobacteraceae bacterium]